MDIRICRVCLVRNVKMSSLRETKLDETFELISCTKLNPEDGNPDTICFMCMALLVKCRKFRAMSHNATELLTKLFEDKFKLTPETSLLLDNRTHIYLTQSAVQHTNFDDIEAGTVKEEFTESADNNENEIPLAQIKREAPKKLQESKIRNISRTDVNEVKSEETVEIFLKKEEESENMQKQTEYDSKTPDESSLSFCCSVCNKKHVSKKTLEHHMKVHDQSRPFVCEICAYRFKTKDYLIKHKKTVHRIVIEAIECSICQKIMNSPQILKRHMKIHLKSLKTHACDKCELKFGQKSTLIRHKATHIEDLPVKPHSCPICGKSFSVIYNLQNHLKLHSGEKPFTCERCGKAYTLNSHLKIHMRTHTGERPYSCSVCQKSFAEYTNMKTHMVTHTGVKPYACDRCGKTFTKKCSMKKHIQYVHLKEKSHICEMCSKSYSKRQALKDHMRSHTGERPFKCEKCCKTFMTNDYIKRHMKTHSDQSLE